MKSVWIASLVVAALTSTAFAQSTIYKLVDDSGRVTYSNKPMKGAVVMDFEPLTTIPATPQGVLTIQKPSAPAEKAEIKPAVAIVTPVATTLAAIEPQLQRRRDEGRRRILESELDQEEHSLSQARQLLAEEQQNPMLIAAVRVAQLATDPTPTQALEFRANIEKASGRIRGLQATVAEHEKNIEALKKELGALKP